MMRPLLPLAIGVLVVGLSCGACADDAPREAAFTPPSSSLDADASEASVVTGAVDECSDCDRVDPGFDVIDERPIELDGAELVRSLLGEPAELAADVPPQGIDVTIEGAPTTTLELFDGEVRTFEFREGSVSKWDEGPSSGDVAHHVTFRWHGVDSGQETRADGSTFEVLNGYAVIAITDPDTPDETVYLELNSGGYTYITRPEGDGYVLQKVQPRPAQGVDGGEPEPDTND